MSKVMNAKFAGTCTACKGSIAVGARIVWTKGVGVVHYGQCPAVVAPAPAPARVVPNITIDASGILALLNTAKAHLKFPKMRFRAPSGGELVLVPTGANSKYPGAVNVKVDRAWHGRIEANGTVTQGAAFLIPTLQAIAVDPAKAAKDFGALTGRCSFCNLPLTDEGSVEVGYGPVCAKHYGLPHTAKGTKVVSTPVVVAPKPVVVPSTDHDAVQLVRRMLQVGKRTINTIEDVAVA